MNISKKTTPQELKNRDQWVLWCSENRNGEPTKVPYQTNGNRASTANPADWKGVEAIKDAYKDGQFSGVGFVFSEDDPFVGVDLDHCITDGKIEEWAHEIVDALDSYTEVSPSGDGLHIIVQGTLPGDRCRSGNVEMYEDSRYFTVTGDHLKSTPDQVSESQDSLTQVYRAYLLDDTTDSSSSGNSGSIDEPLRPSDAMVLDKIWNSNQAEKFGALWEGDQSLWEGEDAQYSSQSEADLALLCILCYWKNGGREQMDRLFRASGLYRSKWERDDYRERTIAKALEFCDAATDDAWASIRDLYDSDCGGEARLEAAKQIGEELQVATDRNSEQILVYDENKTFTGGGEQKIEELLVHELWKYHSTYQAREIKAKVRAFTYRDNFGGEFIPVANGDLFLDPFELKECDPERAPRSRSPASWDPNATCPIFRNHLNDVVPNEQERRTLQEYFGYCLYHWGIPFHKALFVVGPTASGKSTTLKVLQKMMGNTSEVSPQKMVNGRFGASELEGSWVNIRSDLSSGLVENVGLFKEIVAGDKIHIERKHEQGYTIRPTAKHLYSANQLPRVSRGDNAFYRRILIVSFPKTIPVEDQADQTAFDRKLESELDGILRWSLEGLLRVLKNDGFTHDLSPRQTRRRWEEYTSSIGQFKASKLRVTGDDDDVVSKEKLYSVYSTFCEKQGLSTETKGKLTRVLTEDPQLSDSHRTPPDKEKQVRCYVGVEIR